MWMYYKMFLKAVYTLIFTGITSAFHMIRAISDVLFIGWCRAVGYKEEQYDNIIQ